MSPTFLPNGKEVAGWIFVAGTVSLSEVPPGNRRIVWQAHTGVIEGLAVSPDGRFLASVGNDGARIWRVSDQQEVSVLKGHQGDVCAAAFSPDGKWLATSGREDLTIRIWDLPEAFHVKR